MDVQSLILPMFAHVIWVTLLYFFLTMARAPQIWGVGAREDGTNPWNNIEPKISANLSNQFEWPLFFYSVCILQIAIGNIIETIQVYLAWAFIVGRIFHSVIQILTTNIKLRGTVFNINFLAVLAMWILLFISELN